MTIPSTSGTSPITPGGDPGEAARRRVEALVSSGELPGLQYQVVSPAGVVFAAAAGVRDVATGQPMSDSTLQMAYSMTKAITAIAVLQLSERGRIDLDAPLGRSYADHPYGPEVTVRRLLAHTAGIHSGAPLKWFVLPGQPFDRDAKLRELLARNPRLKHRPGEAYGYSNLGYWLLEKAIENAAGQDYAAYVAEQVFRPLGVSPAATRFSADGPGELAVGHAPRWSPITLLMELLTPAPYWSRPHGRWARSARVETYGRAYGGLYATAGALGAVLQDLLREDSSLLGPAAKAAMFERQPTAPGRPPAGALGWVIGELRGERYLGKQGGGLGFHGNLRIFPARGLATVLLANRAEISPGPIDARTDTLDVFFLE